MAGQVGDVEVHPLQGDELRALRPERGGPMTPKSFHAQPHWRLGQVAFPHLSAMLRHGCGYALANASHDTRALQAWLGHKNIQQRAVTVAH